MRHFYLFLGTFLWLSLGLKAQNYTADEMLEIQAHQQSLVDLSISNPFQPTFSAPTFGTDSTMADWIPTAGATETFAPAVGDFFFDPGGPGGGPDEAPGNYPNCGCATQTTLEGVSQIKIIDMDIFANFDYLRIYDGTDTSGTLLFGNGQGDPNDGDYSLPAGTILDAASGNFFFYFHASTVVNRLGWEIEIMEADGTTDPDPEPQHCSQGIPSFATVPNANGITIGEGYRVAEDFTVEEGTTFTMNQFTFDMNMAELPNAVIVYIHEDEGGYPGAIIETIDMLHTSSQIVGSAFGDPIHHLIFELDTPIEFEEGTYWISPTMSVPSGDTAWWATTDQASDGSLPKYSNDEGDTWVDSTSGTHMIFTVSGICEGEGTTEPEDGCLWTVTVSDDDFGDEVEWELRDQTTGTVLLSGGGYGFVYSDVQTVTAEGPVEFYISTVGFYGDNTPSYSIENENGVILSGVAPGGTTQTFSDMTCDDLPPPPPNLTCEDNFVASNNLENGIFLGGDTNQRLAVDVIVGDEGFTVYGMDLNIFTDGNTELDFYFTVYEDDAGLPGAVFNDNGYGQVISNEYLGEAFGYDVYNFVVKFDSSVDLEANTTYWIEVESTGVAWEATEVNSLGSGLAFLNDNVTDWTDGSPDELVYSLVCEQLGVSDLSSFDFAYYPNPVRDVLNITSQKAVQSVEVYNLTGQRVMSESMVNQSQIDVSKLTTGTYVFRVTLEDGQVETFKIVKK